MQIAVGGSLEENVYNMTNYPSRSRSLRTIKKATAVACAAVTAASFFTAHAQTLVPRWQNPTAAGGTTTRDLAYNHITGNVLLVHTAPRITRWQGSDGLSAGADMDVSTVSQGTEQLRGIAVQTDGTIWACNYVIGAQSTNPLKLYRWANEGSVPEVAATLPTVLGVAADRFGSGLDIFVRPGISTNFLFGGTAANAMFASYEGTTWTFKVIAVASQTATPGLTFIDYGTVANRFRFVAKSRGSNGQLYNFDPTAVSPITPTATAMTGNWSFQANGITSHAYDPVTKLLGGLTCTLQSGTFDYTNSIYNAAASVNAPTLTSFIKQNAAGADGGTAGGTAWGAGALFSTIPSLTAAVGINAFDVTAFLVSGPADVVKTAGDASATMTAVFGGSSLTYVWKKGATVLTDDSKYSGTGTASLTINNLLVSDSDTYTVTVTGVQASTATASGSLVVNATAAGPKVWNGAGADNNWSNADNWSGIPLNLAGDSVFFDGITRLSPLMNGAYSVEAMTFNSGAGAFVVNSTGDTLKLAGGLTNSSVNDQTLSLPVAIASGNHNFNADAGKVMANGAISGLGGITKLGTQSLRLGGSAPNTFAGGLTMSGGDVHLSKSSSNAVGGVITVSSGTLFAESSDQIADNAVIDLQTSGRTLSLANGATDTIRGFSVGPLNAGTVSGNVQLGDTAQLTVTPSVAIGYSTVSVTASNPAGTKLIIGASTGGGELRWTPTNMVNTFEKLQINSGGKLRLGHGGNAWNGQDTMLGVVPATFAQDQISINNGHLGFNGGLIAEKFIVNANRGMTITGIATNETLVNTVFPGKITGTGTLAHSGGADLAIPAFNDFTGGLHLYAGSVTVSDHRNVGTGPIAFKQNGATLGVSATGITITNKIDLSAVLTNTFGGSLTNGTNFTLSGPVDMGSSGQSPRLMVSNANTTITFSGEMTNLLGLTKIGPGTVLLSGNNSYAGVTVVSNGTLSLATGASLGTNLVYLRSATAVLNAAQTLTLSQPDRVIINEADGSTLSAAAGAKFILDDAISGTFGLNIAGPGEVVVNNGAFHSGTITVSSGKLTVNSTVPSPVTVNALGTLGGIGLVTDVIINGTLAPGNGVGKLTSINHTWNAGGTYKWEMNDATGGTGIGWDQVQINGTLSIGASAGGKFNVDVTSLAGAVAGNAANFNNTLAQSWTLVTADSGILNFDPTAFNLVTTSFGNSLGGGTFGITNSGNSLLVTFTPSTGGQGAQNFQSVTAGSGTFTGTPNTSYTVQYTDSLSPINWQTLMTVMTDGTGAGAFTDAAPNSSQRFYRIVLP